MLRNNGVPLYGYLSVCAEDYCNMILPSFCSATMTCMQDTNGHPEQYQSCHLVGFLALIKEGIRHKGRRKGGGGGGRGAGGRRHARILNVINILPGRRHDYTCILLIMLSVLQDCIWG